MTNQLLVSLVNSVLGTGSQTARGNYAYHCKQCNHRKPKLEICFDENSPHYQNYACWVCGPKLKGKKLINLFKKLQVSPDKIQQLVSITKDKINIGDIKVKQEKLELPKEFKFLHNPSGLISKHALNYLKNRRITKEDILRYNIGYCEYGPYNNMIVIPSYDEKGELNYFISRSFIKDSKIKYKNPSVSRNIIAFDYYINWNLPVILCEGTFDAIAIKRNAIPLLGKNIQSELMKKIIKSEVKQVYVALDADALNDALRHCEILMNEGKEVYLVDLEEKDPSELGSERFWKKLQTTTPLNYGKLMEVKLQMI